MRLSVLVSLLCLGVARSSHILGLFPFGAKSHFAVFDSLMRELAKRGHDVLVVSPFPPREPVRNYTNIDVKSSSDTLINAVTFEGLPTHILNTAKFFWNDIDRMAGVLKSPELKCVMAKNATFDLVFIEVFSHDVFLLVARNFFSAPVIGFASSYTFPWSLAPMAVPHNPSYVPAFFSGFSGRMSFYQRLHNTLLVVSSKLYHGQVLLPKTRKVFETHLGESLWSFQDAFRNISLVLVNTHFSFHGARPHPPQVVEVGGVHLQPPGHLSQELDRWMNESTEGVIYFSFGSMLRGATLPVDKVKAFLQVFEKLPQRVLWKWEDDAVDRLPSNVKIMKWLPQRDVLAHPKVRVFISHGGLLGTTEAVVSGVPILGIPMYGDQPNNVAALVENGVAIHVDYNNISVASLSYALNTLLHDKRYKENAKELSRRFLDRPQTPLETAVYWTEYVIRHRGAPHLQSAAVHLTWYQYYLLDVAAVCLAVLLAALAVVYYTLRFSLGLLCSVKSTKLKTN